MTNSIALFGCGRMGSALATGWLRSEKPPEISIQDPKPAPLVEDWAEADKIKLNAVPSHADILIVAVKPQIFPSVVEQVKGFIGADTLVLSIMAGISLEGLVEALGTNRIARAMPNTPGAVSEGVTLIAGHDSLTEDDYAAIRALLEPLGAVEGPMTERELQLATTISGCGPAYAFLLVEAMAAGGVELGLDPDLSMRLARQTVIGAGALMKDSEESAEALRVGVTSPGGVTAAALDVLMGEPGFTSVMKNAVKNALKRDEELSG